MRNWYNISNEEIKSLNDNELQEYCDYNPCHTHIVAEHGTDHQRSLMLKYVDRYTRWLIAIYGNDHLRNELINDFDRNVRMQIAINGNENHRTMLALDKDILVRTQVLESTDNTYTLKILAEDTECSIADFAKLRLNKLGGR